MDLAAILQCYKNPLATYKCLESFRRFYPDSQVVLYSDNGYDYTEMAKHFNCTYFHESVNLHGASVMVRDGDYFQNVCRLRKMISLVDASYYILLEDDVQMVSRYTEDFRGDINGNCVNKIRKHTLGRIPFSCVKNEDKSYTGHGGSVYKTKTMVELLNNDKQIKWLIEHWEDIGLGPVIDDDIFLSLLVVINGGTIHHLTQHKDLLTNHVRSTDGIAALHQFKHYYGKALPDNLKHLVNEEVGSSDR